MQDGEVAAPSTKGKIVTEPDSRRASMIDKVRGLLAKAENAETTPEEAQLFREKADQLMVKYQMDEEELRAAGLATEDNIINRKMWLYQSTLHSFYRNGKVVRTGNLDGYYLQLFFTLARHQNVKHVVDYNSEGTWATVYGYQSDIDMLEMIYLQVRIHMIEMLEPNVKGMERGAAVKALHDAGVQFPRIAQILGVKYTAANIHGPYRDECRRLGVEMTSAAKNMEGYRLGLAEGFTKELSFRVYQIEMRRREWAREQDKDRGDGNSLAVLDDRADRVREAFYEAYPHLRPQPLDPNAPRPEPCAKCMRAKSGRCRDHSYGKIRYVNIDSRAESLGRAAAQKIDLGATRVSDRTSAKGLEG